MTDTPDGTRRAWLVTGRVQGVAFRASARRRALELGLAGLAENLPDGRVRVVAAGEREALDRLADWLSDGPPAARVSDVEEVTVGDDPLDGFSIRRGSPHPSTVRPGTRE